MPSLCLSRASIVALGLTLIAACTAKPANNGVDAGEPYEWVDAGPSQALIGTLGGRTLSYGSAVTLFVPDAGDGTFADILISTEPVSGCAFANDLQNPANPALSLNLSQGTMIPGPTTYTIGTSPDDAVGLFFAPGEMCTLVAGTGTINVTAMGLTPGTSSTGTFDVFFGTQEVSGGFIAPFCQPPDAGTVDAGTSGADGGQQTMCQ